MKAGNKVSFSLAAGINAPRQAGIVVSVIEAASLVLIAAESPQDVRKVVAVPEDRVAEMERNETIQAHTDRLYREALAEAQEKAQKVREERAAKRAAAEAKESKGGAAAIIVLLISLAFSFSAGAAEQIKLLPYSFWSGGSTNGASTLSWVIVPAHSSVATAIPVVTSIDATTDKLAAKVQCYKVQMVARCSTTNTTVSIPVDTTNTAPGNIAWDSGTIIIRHMLTDQYEKRTLATSGGSTNIEVSAAPLEKVVPGDLIYSVTTTGAPAFTVSTNGAVAATGLSFCRLQGASLVVGQPGFPLLMEVDGTGANATLNNVTARYEQSAVPVPRPGL